jgi:adenylosuccinate lyase
MHNLAIRVIGGMRVYPERMRENLELTHGAIFSQGVLSALVEAGLGRDAAYRVVQRAAQTAWDARRPFRELLEQDVDVSGRIGPEQLDELFDYGRFVRNVPVVFERLDALVMA